LVLSNFGTAGRERRRRIGSHPLPGPKFRATRSVMLRPSLTRRRLGGAVGKHLVSANTEVLYYDSPQSYGIVSRNYCRNSSVCGHRVDRVFRTHLYSSVLSVPLLLGPVIVMPSADRSIGRSPGRRGRGSSPARLSSHQAQARESRERLLDLAAASYDAFWPPPKSADTPSSPSWQDCTMKACTDTVLLWVTDRGLLGSISAVLNRYWGIA